ADDTPACAPLVMPGRRGRELCPAGEAELGDIRVLLPARGTRDHARSVGLQTAANGPGQAAIFGIEKRPIVPNCGAGLQACATPASQATERKMNASSIEKPCSSTSIRAASSDTSCSASSNASAVACGTQQSASSV